MVYVPRVEDFPAYVAGNLSTVSEVAVPLVIGDTLMGVLNLESNRANAFSIWDRRFLRSVAPLIALSLRNAQLFADSQSRGRHMAGVAGEVTQVADGLLGLAEQLAAAAEDVGAGAEEIAATVAQIARGTETQADQVEQASLAVGAIAESADSLTQMVSSVEGSFQRSGETTAVATRDLEGLGDQLNEIQKVVTLVDEFADRTDLLALNAAIEAAHAGQHGRGFAVVAEEVRRLAENSARSVARIAALSDEIESRRAAVQGSMQAVGAALVEAQRVGDVVTGSSAVHLEQVHEVMAAVAEIATIAIQSTEATEQVAAAMDQQAVAMSAVTRTAHQVAKMASSLQQVVDELQNHRQE
jgi:methyl-accepting chemotaxis protein